MSIIVYDPSTNPLNTNKWAFPVLECIHIIGFALSTGTIAIVDHDPPQGGVIKSFTGSRQLVGSLSPALWLSVVAGGLLIAFV